MSYLIGIYFLLFGLIVGSFLNVVILRLPEKKDLVFKRSSCPKCGNQLKWFHNLPVLSYVFLQGRCSFCKERISLRYPIIEMVMGLISLFLAPDVIDVHHLFDFIFYFTVAAIFLCHLVIDLKHYLLLDSLNLYLLCLMLIRTFFTKHYLFWLSGGLIGFLVPLTVTWLFYKIKGQIGLGGGDIKLYGILGIYLGPVGVMLTIFMSCFVGAIWGGSMIFLKKMTKDRPMAFGPAILLVASFQIYFPHYASIVQSWFF